MSAVGEIAILVLSALWLMLPAYLSNMLPVFVGGGPPIDLGRTWKRDGKRILGDGKTWRGLLVAPLLAAGLTYFLVWVVRNTAWGAWGFPDWGPAPWWFLFAYMMGLGALVGDAFESFVKRRTGRDRGEKWFPWDQLDFILGALLFGALTALVLSWTSAVRPNLFESLFTLPRLVVILLLTPVLHLGVNWIGWKLGLKDVPW